MEKRYQVFVSSTYEHLKEERSKVITALLDLGHIPCGMEYFPASDEDAWNCIERLIPQCDYYVVLVAGKYGSIAPGDTRAYTHKEYELAVASQVPVLGLLHKYPDRLPKNQCESDPKTQKKLDKFRQLVQKRLCRYWTTSDQISGELLASLSHQISRTPRVGWVRADTIASDEAKSEIIGLRKKLEKAEGRIAQFEKLKADEENELASGKDEMRLYGTLSGHRQQPVPGKKEEVRMEVELSFTLISDWGQLLRFIGSELKREWNTHDLERCLSAEVSRLARNEENFERTENIKGLYPQWDEGEIGKITNQLLALGLIVGRAYPDWALTQKGVLHTSRQRALKKGELRSGNGDWCKVEIEEDELVIDSDVVVEEW